MFVINSCGFCWLLFLLHKRLDKKRTVVPYWYKMNNFNKIDGFIRVYDRNSYLVLFGPEKYDFIHNRIRYLLNQKCY